MVRIRLRRIGSKKAPHYRIVVLDKRAARDSRYIEALGYYNPRTQPHTVQIEEERALYWLSVGAQPTEAVEGLFSQNGTMDRFKRMRDGEDVETLVAEAVAAQEAAEPISPKTSYPAPAQSASNEPVAVAVDDVDAIEEEAAEETEAAE